MKIHLRQRKSSKTNRITLYLEFYKGYKKDENGKIIHDRDYEKLEYYLIEKPKTPTEKQHNKENLKGAEAVKAKRILEVQNGSYGFLNHFKQSTNLIAYFSELTEKRKESDGNYGNWRSALKHLENYCTGTTTFKDVDTNFLEGFKSYLLSKAKTKSGKNLSTNSAHSYFNKFRAVLNKAFDEGIVSANPLRNVKGIQQAETHRQFLTIDEVRAIAKVECRYEVLKNAFIFSCLTGLRWSDIHKLTWKEVVAFNGGWRINFIQKKTKGVEYLDISDQARSFLGQEGERDARVFMGLKYSAYVNVELTKWMLKAGITKPITFHCARHTFATLQLTEGTDIITVSKLLGHSELKTTLIYAKVIDQKKREAANIIPDIRL